MPTCAQHVGYGYRLLYSNALDMIRTLERIPIPTQQASLRGRRDKSCCLLSLSSRGWVIRSRRVNRTSAPVCAAAQAVNSLPQHPHRCSLFLSAPLSTLHRPLSTGPVHSQLQQTPFASLHHPTCVRLYVSTRSANLLSRVPCAPRLPSPTTRHERTTANELLREQVHLQTGQCVSPFSTNTLRRF